MNFSNSLPFRPHALLELGHDLVRRQPAIEVAGHVDFPADNLGKRNKTSEVGLRILLTQDWENLLAIGAPVVFEISEEGSRKAFDCLPAVDKNGFDRLVDGELDVGRS